VEILWILLGGMAGALSRFGVAGFFQNLSGSLFPWGTFSVNIIGSFLIGVAWGFTERFAVLPDLRAFIFIGFLGAFTTFSSYSLETINLIREGEYYSALFNFLLNNFGAFFATFAGLMIIHYIFSK